MTIQGTPSTVETPYLRGVKYAKIHPQIDTCTSRVNSSQDPEKRTHAHVHDVGVPHAGLQRRLANQQLGLKIVILRGQLPVCPAAFGGEGVQGLWRGKEGMLRCPVRLE
jgi:hypothetical protein